MKLAASSEVVPSVPVAPESAVSLIVAPRAKPMEVAATTLKQNAALLDRLRRVAMKSERPGGVSRRQVEILSLPDEEPSEPTTDPVITSDIEVLGSAPDLSMPDLPTPLQLNSLPPEGIPAAVAQERHAEEPNEGEPVTSMSPALRRAKAAEDERAAARMRLRLRAAGVAVALVVVAVAVGVGVYSGGGHAPLHATTSRAP